MNKDLQAMMDNIPTISIRIDKKDMINQLRGLSDGIVELWVNPKNLKVIYLKDRTHYYTIKTRN